MRYTASDIIDLLQLEPLSFEGGYFRRVYTSDDVLSNEVLPERYRHSKGKSLYSTIYYLLTPDTFSRLHRLPTDEIFHFYLGNPVEMLQLDQDGIGRIILIGNRLLDGHKLQVRVPRHTWQGCRLAPGGNFALMGVTLSPAFDEQDFETPKNTEALLAMYPKALHDMIRRLMP